MDVDSGDRHLAEHVAHTAKPSSRRRVWAVAVAVACVALIAGLVSAHAFTGGHHGAQSGGPATSSPASESPSLPAARHLPPVPSALIAELNRHRASLPIRIAAANAVAQVGEATALVTARRDGAHLGKITSASLVSMGLPGSMHTLTTPHKVWMFGIAHPTGSPVSGGPVVGHSGPNRAPHKPNFAAEFVDATTGKWIEGTTGYDPNYSRR